MKKLAPFAVAPPAPLEPAWRGVLERSLPSPVRADALSALVERQSRAYNGESQSLSPAEQRAARVLFFFPRDLHKPALPLAELALLGALDGEPLRVLDLGAGVGASAAGLLRTHAALARERPSLAPLASLLCVDDDALALAQLERTLASARAEGLLPAQPAVLAREGDLRAPERWLREGEGPFDLVLLGTALVELTRGKGDEASRGRALAALIEPWLATSRLSSRGVLVVLEPASKPESRALQRARAELLAKGHHLVAPCTHAGACPLLERETDWCHEDVAVDLPPWLHATAREAGLRYQGLTFAYQSWSVRPGFSLASRAPQGLLPLRLVAEPRGTKGKVEALACGPVSEGVTALKLMELERDTRKFPEAERLEARPRGALYPLAPREGLAQGATVRLSPPGR